MIQTHESGNYGLVSPEAKHLYGGSEIPREVWEPLLGRELTALWDQLLENEGDSVYVRGSTAVKVVFGGYMLDVKQNRVAKAMHADVDVMIADKNVASRVAESEFYVAQGNVATSLQVEETPLHAVTSETIRSMNGAALQEAIAWYKQNGDGRTELLDELIALQKEIAVCSDEELLGITEPLPYESLAVKLERGVQGDIIGTMVDPRDTLRDPLTSMQLSESQQAGRCYGVSFKQCNESTVQGALLELFQDSNGIVFDNNVPLYVLGNIPRMIKAGAELDLDLIGAPNIDNEFPLLYNLADRVLHDERPFIVEKAGEEVEVKPFFVEAVQQSLARSVISNLDVTYDTIFLHFPLGHTLSEDVGHFFEEYHNLISPNNEIMFLLKQNGLPPELDIPPIWAAINFHNMCGHYFGAREMVMENINNNHEDTYTMHDVEQYPENMSQIVSMIVASMGWTMENDRGKIVKIVEGWLPSGDIRYMWKRKEIDFEAGLNMEKIERYMPGFEQRVKEQEAEYARRRAQMNKKP